MKRLGILFFLLLIAAALLFLAAPETERPALSPASRKSSEANLTGTAALPEAAAGAQGPSRSDLEPEGESKNRPLEGHAYQPPGTITVLVHPVDDLGKPLQDAEALGLTSSPGPPADASVAGSSVSGLDLEAAFDLRKNEAWDRAGPPVDGVLELTLPLWGIDYWIVAEAPGMARTARWLQRATPGSRIDLGEVILRPGRSAQVRVRAAGGTPVEKAVVRVISEPPAEVLKNPPLRVQEGDTDAAGVCSLEHLARGPARVQVEARGFLPAEAALPDSGFLDVDLERGGSLRVMVKNPGGAPAAGIPVKTYRIVPGRTPRVDSDFFQDAPKTDAEGRVAFSGLEAGVSWRVAALAGDYEVEVSEPVKTGGETELVLPALFLLQGRLVAGAKPPGPESFFVLERSKDPRAFVPDVRNDRRPVPEDGRFRIEVPRGRYVFAASAHGFEYLHPEEFEVQGPTDLGDLAMVPTIPMTLEFVEADTGRPVAGIAADCMLHDDIRHPLPPRPQPQGHLRGSLARIFGFWPPAENGRIESDRLGREIYRFRVSAGDFGRADQVVDLRDGRPVLRRVELSRPAKVVLTFQVPAGRTAEGLRVGIAPLDREDSGNAHGGGSANVDASGRAVISGSSWESLRGGRYRVRVAGNPVDVIELQPGQENRFTLDLRSLAWLDVGVFHGTRVLPDSEIDLVPVGSESDPGRRPLLTLPDGRFRFPPFAPGAYKLEIVPRPFFWQPPRSVGLVPGPQTIDVLLEGVRVAFEVDPKWKAVRFVLRVPYTDRTGRPFSPDFFPILGRNVGRETEPGAWVVEKVPVGKYFLGVMADGAAFWRSDVFSVAERDVDLGRIPLEAAGGVAVRLSGWSASLERPPYLGLVSVASGSIYRGMGSQPDPHDPEVQKFAHLPPGEYRLQAVWSADGPQRKKTWPAFEVEAGKIAPLELDFSE